MSHHLLRLYIALLLLVTQQPSGLTPPIFQSALGNLCSPLRITCFIIYAVTVCKEDKKRETKERINHTSIALGL